MPYHCKALENPFCLLSLWKLFVALCDDLRSVQRAAILMSESHTCQGFSGTSAVNTTADCPPADLLQQLRT